MNYAVEDSLEQSNGSQLSLYPNFEYEVIANCKLYVYFHQARMDILLEDISYVGIWTSGQEILISVTDFSTNVEVGKLYSFPTHYSSDVGIMKDVEQEFKECVRLIMLDKAEDYIAFNRTFPR